MVATTDAAAMLITETVPSSALVTQANWPSGVAAIPVGVFPTVTLCAILNGHVLTYATVLLPVSATSRLLAVAGSHFRVVRGALTPEYAG